VISQHCKQGTALVIENGFGGLATAIRLQAAGHAVTLVEADY
jgi:phytoene dehydrogenase-like protein